MTIQTVKAGDTLSAMVARYNSQNGTRVSVDQVAKLNGLSNPNLIRAGAQLRFPDAFETARAPGPVNLGGGASSPLGVSGTGQRFDRAPDPANYDLDSISGRTQFNKDMFTFQSAMPQMVDVPEVLRHLGKGSMPDKNNYDLNSISGRAAYNRDAAKFIGENLDTLKALSLGQGAAQAQSTPTPAATSQASTQAQAPSGPRPNRTSNPDKSPDPAEFNMESLEGQRAFNQAFTDFQTRLSAMQNYYKAVSDILKGQSDVQAKISGNLR